MTIRRLLPILEKVEAGERLSFDDGRHALPLATTSSALGYLANLVRERLHGNVTYFNVNRHINPTDVCVASCRSAPSARKRRDPNAYTMSLERGLADAPARAGNEAVTEFHIVGGLHPELDLDWYCEMLRGLKERFPQVHLKAFTMVEIAYFARRAKMPVRESLQQLARCRHGLPARRRRRDLLRARAPHHLRSQDRRRRMARDGAHRARARASTPTAPCSTATSRTTRTASTTW